MTRVSVFVHEPAMDIRLSLMVKSYQISDRDKIWCEYSWKIFVKKLLGGSDFISCKNLVYLRKEVIPY
jgi:hypothetical protein